jgi:hypothetical protein
MIADIELKFGLESCIEGHGLKLIMLIMMCIFMIEVNLYRLAQTEFSFHSSLQIYQKFEFLLDFMVSKLFLHCTFFL